ncbi:hypothetical protein [Mesorhizobium sp. B2-6-2]|nr:hypothetical protein [Mesorhizobium sp. B2-6-2]
MPRAISDGSYGEGAKPKPRLPELLSNTAAALEPAAGFNNKLPAGE